MSDESIQTPAPVIDPVAEARKIMSGQGPATGEVEKLKSQVKALWVVTIVTLVLVIAIGVFSLLPRTLGIGRPNFGGGNFRPGMQQGPGQGVGQPVQP